METAATTTSMMIKTDLLYVMQYRICQLQKCQFLAKKRFSFKGLKNESISLPWPTASYGRTLFRLQLMTIFM
jgi:hypothetical protein